MEGGGKGEGDEEADAIFFMHFSLSAYGLSDRKKTLNAFNHYNHYIFPTIYTVNHKKRDILFFTILWLALTDFYSCYIILIVKKF